jgi:phage antirepressor YoqD-like protein
MLDVLKKDASIFGGIYKDSYGREKPCFNLDRELTMTLVSGYDIPLRHRVVTRLAELEAQQAPKLPAIPQTFAQALMLAAQQAQEIEAQQALIEQQKPAVEFLGRYVEAKSSKGIREVAKVLGIPERKFIARLEEDGILFRQGSNLLPYAQHQHAGYFEVKTGESSGHAYHQTRFTPAGVAWIARRMTLQPGRTARVARAQPASNDARAQKPI